MDKIDDLEVTYPEILRNIHCLFLKTDLLHSTAQ